MAAFSSIALGIGTAASLASSANQISKGNKTAKAAENAINNYERQEIRNLADDIVVDNSANEWKARQQDQGFAQALNIVQQSGNFGNISALVNQNLQAKSSIANDIAMQQQKLQDLKLSEERNKRSLIDSRETADLAGLGQQAQFGRQQAAQGWSAAASSLTTLAKYGISQETGGGDKTTDPNSTDPNPGWDGTGDPHA